MNCDEFLEALESPDERRRTAARWHATSCPDCAALAEVHAQLQQELGRPEPLPPRMREVWVEAARPTLSRSASEGSFRNLPLHRLSLAAAIVLLVTVTVLIWQSGKQPSTKPDIVKDQIKYKDNNALPLSPPTIVTIDASEDLTRLLAQVNALEADLKNTARQAELVDARRQAKVLLATYSQW